MLIPPACYTLTPVLEDEFRSPNVLDHTGVGIPKRGGCGQMGDGLVCPVSVGLDDPLGPAVWEDLLPVPPPRDGHVRWVEAPHIAGQHHRLPRVKRSGFGYLHGRWACTGGKKQSRRRAPPWLFLQPGFSPTSMLLGFCPPTLPTLTLGLHTSL